MKRIFLILIGIVLLAASFSVCSSAAQYINSSTAPIIDGNIDNFWYEQPLNYIDNILVGNSTISADYRMVWNNNNIYLLVRVFDSDIASSGSYSERDGITLWINPTNKRGESVYKIMITAPADSGIRVEGDVKDLSVFERTARKAYVKTDYGYMIEASFDLSSLYEEFSASDGTTIGFDIWVTDQTTGTANVISWCGYDGGPTSILKDCISFMTVSVPDTEAPSVDTDNRIPGTSDSGIHYIIFATLSFAGMMFSGIRRKENIC